MKMLSLMLVTVLLFTGCGMSMFGEQNSIQPGERGYMWTGKNGRSFVTEHCPRLKTYASDPEPCARVTVAAEPPGQEAYSFVYKIKIRSLVGIPYGEAPITVYVVGDRAECDRRATAQHLSAGGPTHEGNGHLSADPAERCAGPVWVRS